MKILRFLFTASKGVIMGGGFGFTAILAVLSLSVRNGAMTEAKVDLSSLTSGSWVYVWTASLLVFFIGTLSETAMKAVAMYKKKRREPYSSPREYGDSGRKFR